MLRNRCWLVTLSVTVMVPLAAQDLQWLRNGFERRSYLEILGPLVDYRLGLGNETGRIVDEVDYMVATTFCALREHKEKGCRYAIQLNPMVWTGSQLRRAADLFGACCAAVKLQPPCPPGVVGKVDDPASACATVDGKFDRRSAIAPSVPSKLEILTKARDGSPGQPPPGSVADTNGYASDRPGIVADLISGRVSVGADSLLLQVRFARGTFNARTTLSTFLLLSFA